MPTQEQHQWLADLGVAGVVDRVEDAAGAVASDAVQTAADAGSAMLDVASDGMAGTRAVAGDYLNTVTDAGSTVATVAGDVVTGSYGQAVQDASAGASRVGGDLAQTAGDVATTAGDIADDATSGAATVADDAVQTAKDAAAPFEDNPEDHQEPEHAERDRTDPAPSATLPRPMQPDCKVVHGKVPGPANHVMCSTHGHILDTTAKQIIAEDLADYQQRYGKGKGKGGGGTPTPPQPNPTGPLEPGDVAIVGGKKYVIYSDEIRQGGTVSWMCRNPGNIRSGERYGAFSGKKFVTNSVGAFAIFPDEATGHAAILKLLKDYGHITILDTMKKYAPKGDGKNNPEAYAAAVAKRVGVTIDTYLDTLSEAQKQKFAAEIKRIEGWEAGTSFARDDAKLPDEIKQRLQ